MSNYIMEKDKQNLEALMQNETICWGEVTRLDRKSVV